MFEMTREKNVFFFIIIIIKKKFDKNRYKIKFENIWKTVLSVNCF